MSTIQPEALRLADWLEDQVVIYQQFSEGEPGGYAQEVDQVMDEAAAELRRQHADLVHADRYAEQLGRELAKAGAEIADLRAQLASIGGVSPPEGMAGWTTLPGQLPEPGMPVLLDIGKKFPIRALWAAKHTVPAHDEADGDWVEYDEATDEVYCPEGWYEWNRHEETHWAVNAAPVAWCELPPLASEAKGAI